jgi:hypothetical protein
MLSRTLNQIAQSPWANLVWAAIGVLVLVQMVAFYRVCTSQVERAHARQAVVTEQSNAMSDCLDYLARSTISSCSRPAARNADNGDPEAGSLAARDLPRSPRGAKAVVLGSPVPVSYVFH